MDLRAAVVLLSCLVGLSLQEACDQCDCTISAGDTAGVHTMRLSCHEGTITWYNPVGSLRLEVAPTRLEHFETCFMVHSGRATLHISREVQDRTVNPRPPRHRASQVTNDHNLAALLTVQGGSQEYCMSSREPVILYVEPEMAEHLGYQKVTFKYDSTAVTDIKSTIEECRPCSDDEILKAYCSSDFVLVGSMTAVQHYEQLDKTNIHVAVSQIIRHRGSHTDYFTRQHRDSPTLQGSIFAPRKCGVVRGEGLFLMTGRVRLGELHLGCAPYLDEWSALASRAQLEGRMDCTLD